MIKLNKIGKFGRSPTVWYELAGYKVHQSLIADIFGIHLVTLRNRIKSGWDIAPALLIPTDSKLNVYAVQQFAATQDFDERMIRKLKEYFTANPSVI